MTDFWIGTSWKMNKTLAEARVFAEGLADADYLRDRVSGVEETRRGVAQWWPERVERTSGIEVEELRQLDRELLEICALAAA